MCPGQTFKITWLNWGIWQKEKNSIAIMRSLLCWQGSELEIWKPGCSDRGRTSWKRCRHQAAQTCPQSKPMAPTVAVVSPVGHVKRWGSQRGMETQLCMLWRFVKMSLFWLINANFMRAAPCLVFKIVTYLNSLKPYIFSSMSETASKTCRKYMEILVISSACLFGVGAATSRGTGRTFQQLFFSIFSFFSFFCCRACPCVCCHSCLCQTNKINWSSLAATGSRVSQSWLLHILFQLLLVHC